MVNVLYLPICYDTVYFYRLKNRVQEYHVKADPTGHHLRRLIRDSQIDLKTLSVSASLSKSDLQAMIDGKLKITDADHRIRIENSLSNHLIKMLRKQRTPRS